MFQAYKWLWASRVKRLADGSISTPEASGIAETDPKAGLDLLAAQARFPVNEPDEMRSHNFMPGSKGPAVRRMLAARIGDYGVGAGAIKNNNWLPEFQAASHKSGPAREKRGLQPTTTSAGARLLLLRAWITAFATPVC